jgi:hypothetical protein
MHTKEPWSFGIKDGDNEIIVAGGDAIAEVFAADREIEEFQANCDLMVNAPLLFRTLEAWAFADADPAAARDKGYYDQAREQRDTLLRQLGSKAVQP